MGIIFRSSPKHLWVLYFYMNFYPESYSVCSSQNESGPTGFSASRQALQFTIVLPKFWLDTKGKIALKQFSWLIPFLSKPQKEGRLSLNKRHTELFFCEQGGGGLDPEDKHNCPHKEPLPSLSKRSRGKKQNISS